MRVLITGANRGIGHGLAARFAARGDQVEATCRSALPDHLPGVTWHPLDVTDPASIQAMAAVRGAAPLDLLVCNAGILPDKGQPLATGYPPAMWAAAFATNVTGTFLTVQALLPALRSGTRPRIALLGSAMGSDARAPGGSYIYRASKAAVLNLGRNLATDLRAQGISLGIYHPGWVQTAMGGPEADIDVATAVTGLIRRFDALDLADSGCFRSYDGQPVPF